MTDKKVSVGGGLGRLGMLNLNKDNISVKRANVTDMKVSVGGGLGRLGTLDLNKDNTSIKQR